MSGPRYSQAGLQSLKAGSRIVPARQQLNLLAAVDDLPARHDCPGLSKCLDHPRWRTVVSYPRTRHYVLAPGAEPFTDVWARPTHAEAVAYATLRARAEQLAAIQDGGAGR